MANDIPTNSAVMGSMPGGFGVERKFLTLFECIGQTGHIFFIVNKKIGVWGAVYVAESRIFFVARALGRK